MPNKERLIVREPPRVDARAQRSTHALAHALIQLIQESDGRFEDITVRQILERARVGRTTFYSHFRSKEDVLHSMYEGMFGLYASIIARERRFTARLFPVREFVDHVAQSKRLMAGLRKAGLADDMKSHFVGYAANIIESRMADLRLESAAVQSALASRMLAAALVESIDWWVDHEAVAADEIDTAFHLLARSLIRARPAYRGADSTARDSERSLVTNR